MTSTSLSPEELVDLQAARVHRDAYTDPAVFTAEMDRIFASTWVYVGHASEIPNPGDYKATKLGCRPVIMAHSSKGEINILMNRCKHRGAIVCQNERGNARFFRCEYHGWTYRNSGELVGITYPEGYPDVNKAELGLDAAPKVAVYRDFVFASLNQDVPPIEEHLAGAKAYLDIFADQGFGRSLKASLGTQEIVYEGNWKFQLENGCDGYHPNFTHRSFFRVMSTDDSSAGSYMDGQAPARALSLGNGHAVLDQRTSQGEHYIERVLAAPDAEEIIASLREEMSEDDLNQLLSTASSSAFNLTVFPNLQLIGVHIREIVPIDVTTTVVKYSPLAVDDVPDGINRLRLRAHELFYSAAGFGVPDDGEMFKRVTAGLGADTEWLLLSRGMQREEAGPEAGTVSAHITDEAPQRGEWARWAELMITNTKDAQ